MTLAVEKPTTRRPTAKAQTNRLKTRLIKATLTAEEAASFDRLRQITGLSQAEYIRRACLRQTIKVVPDYNLSLYAKLGTFQRAAQAVLRVELPADVRKQLEAALADLKTTRLRFLDVDPDTVAGEPALEAKTEAGTVAAATPRF